MLWQHDEKELEIDDIFMLWQHGEKELEIEDIFMLWQHGEKELEKFLKFLNCYHPTIKFTANYSQKGVNFLDVSVRKNNNQLVTDLYIKPANTHQYLHASSCHVYHSKKSIPHSQALRLNRICSEISFYDKRCNELRYG